METYNGSQENNYPGRKLIQQTSIPGTGLIKYSFILLFFLYTMFTGFRFCDNVDPSVATNTKNQSDNNNNSMSSKMKIKIGSCTVTAKIFDNATTTAFKAMLPVTIN